jgi:hypothetical protein
MDGELWGDASVTYPIGRAPRSLTSGRRCRGQGLARTFDLGADAWEVIGISIGEVKHLFKVKIVATPSGVWENFTPDDGGEIEVTEFLVHDADPLAVLRQITHMSELKMLIRGPSGNQVRVRTLSDLLNELFVDENFGPQRTSGALRSPPHDAARLRR